MLFLGLLLALVGCGQAKPTPAQGDPSAVRIGINPVLDLAKPVQVGEEVPELTFELAGKAVKLSDFRGKTVVLNFWATWCGPCRLEMPDFEALQRERSDVIIIGINQRENEEQVRKFASEVGATFPLVLDRTGDIAANFNVNLGLPTTYLIDSQGIIQKVELRAMTRSQLAKYLDELAPKTP
jgi:thiol-disulfide isomerase/thioredoxin